MHPTTATAALGESLRPSKLAHEQALSVLPALQHLLPRGLQRGSAVSVTASPAGGAATLALSLAARPEPSHSWVAVVGLPSLSLVAGFELGLSWERLVVVDCPAMIPGVLAALVDGFDVILIGPSPVTSRDARRLVARLRERGAVLIVVGGDLPGGETTLRLQVTSSAWDDLAATGYLQRRYLRIEATGRGIYARRRRDELVLESSPFGRQNQPLRSSGSRATVASTDEPQQMAG